MNVYNVYNTKTNICFDVHAVFIRPVAPSFVSQL